MIAAPRSVFALAAATSWSWRSTGPIWQRPAEQGKVKAALLVAHGAPDPVTPKADRDAFEAEMNAAGAKWQMVVFSGVLHAYTDQGADAPGIAGWDEAATRQTYGLTHQFLADAFAARL